MTIFMMHSIVMTNWFPRIPDMQAKLQVGTGDPLARSDRCLHRHPRRLAARRADHRVAVAATHDSRRVRLLLLAYALIGWTWSVPSLFVSLFLGGLFLPVVDVAMNVEADRIEASTRQADHEYLPRLLERRVDHRRTERSGLCQPRNRHSLASRDRLRVSCCRSPSRRTPTAGHPGRTAEAGGAAVPHRAADAEPPAALHFRLRHAAHRGRGARLEFAVHAFGDGEPPRSAPASALQPSRSPWPSAASLATGRPVASDRSRWRGAAA